MAGKHLCDGCGSRFTRANDLKRHIIRKHQLQHIVKNTHVCEICKQIFDSADGVSKHIQNIHKPSRRFKVVNKALRGVACLYEKIINSTSIEEAFNKSNIKDIESVLEYEVNTKKIIKASLDISTTYVQYDHTGDVVDRVTITLRSKSLTLLMMSDFKAFILKAKEQICARADDFISNGSGWVLESVGKQRLSIAKQKSLMGGCAHIKFNIATRVKRYLWLPPTNDSNDCFYACIAKHVNPKIKDDEISEYIQNHITKIDDGPMAVKKIDKFISTNKHLNLKVNIVLFEDGVCTPVFCSNNDEATEFISLLLIYEEGKSVGHYALIVDFNNFTATQYKDSSGHMQRRKAFYCRKCLCGFTTAIGHDNHFELCLTNETQRVLIPEAEEYEYFKEYNRTYMKPIVGYLDFECLLTSTEECSKESCLGKGYKHICPHATKNLNNHTPFAWTLLFVDLFDEVIYQNEYYGDDCGEKLIECLLDNEDWLTTLVKDEKPLNMTKEEQYEYDNTSKCVICFNEITDISQKRRHHHHYTGRLIGPAHNTCNLNCYAPNDVVIYVHNFSHYDSMIIIQSLAKMIEMKRDKLKIRVMPHNTERVRTISLNVYKFLDSMDLFHSSLSMLVDDLHSSNHTFPLLDKCGIYKTERQKSMLLRKGVYPYSFGQTIDDLKKAKKIPNRKYFYSDLTSEHISDESYQHAQNVFDEFNCDNMITYAMLYCRLDTILLAECVSKFRQTIYDSAKLDCCAFLSAAHLAFNMFLKITSVKVDLISDIDKILFVEQNIRGGVSFVSHRLAKKTTKNHIGYFDQNNLYGTAQSQLMPISGYRWLTDIEKQEIDWYNINLNGEYGYIVEVTLDYPKELHWRHNDFPLAPEQLHISQEMLSPYSKGEYISEYKVQTNNKLNVFYL